MKTALHQRSPVAKAAWLIGLFMLGWLAFLFIPWPWRSSPPAPMPTMVVRPPSKLQAVGLPDNVDFEGLPQFFAIWADAAEWHDNRTTFAYWHPGARDYLYYFEARRTEGGFRFREIPEPKLDEEHYLDEKLTEDSPIRFYRSVDLPKLKLLPGITGGDPGVEPIKVKIDTRVPASLAPKPPAPPTAAGSKP